jgi:hypothetical protein
MWVNCEIYIRSISKDESGAFFNVLEDGSPNPCDLLLPA